jgi:hypothetical protein
MEPPPLARGVYASPFLCRLGHRQLVAVDSLGRTVTQATVFPSEDEDAIGQMLESLLDQLDQLDQDPLLARLPPTRRAGGVG